MINLLYFLQPVTFDEGTDADKTAESIADDVGQVDIATIGVGEGRLPATIVRSLEERSIGWPQSEIIEALPFLDLLTQF